MAGMNTNENTADVALPDFNSKSASKFRKWRHIKDVATRYLMAFGGIGVIIAIVLIAFYLLYVVIPMFKSAHIESVATYSIPGTDNSNDKTLIYAMEEQREVALRINDQGHAVFFSTKNGEIRKTIDLNILPDVSITTVSTGDQTQRMVALGLSNGSVIFFQHNYTVTFPDDIRLITPGIDFPFGDQAIQVNQAGDPIKQLSVQYDEEQATIAAHDSQAQINLINFVKEESFLSDEVEITREDTLLSIDTEEIVDLKIDVEQRELYIADKLGNIYYYDISDKTEPRLVQKVKAVEDDTYITALEFLAGGISILVGDSTGQIAQWFPVRDDENNYTLQKIRSFNKQNAPITAIAPEFARKGFVAIDENGEMGIYHTTAHRTVLLKQIDDHALNTIILSPRANAALVENDEGQLQFYHIDNEHPEISFQSIWGKVWYESRDKPEYIWQSSSASSDFEPKFSLTPLAYGTFKAAFYAMLFAIPLAIFGAMYTAYFMAPKMRQVVKPTIEIMEALPTVILGFLAGLWLAPFVETHLPGMFVLIIFVPLSIILAAAVWEFVPDHIKHKVPEGWEAALLMPVIILSVTFSIGVSQPIENLFFGGNLPLWLSTEMGITYDQRNSLVVGFAMGFAVIPTIFSISEDAVYSVPKHLTTGSLALGATPWQTMTRVVLLTASPGIFSAIMIGLGRAVGETMIVVMATGNTAIMDMSIFEGFRAMSANIAVEMPETEVNSTHYRILFLGALVLFAITFFFNTIAEVVRQRLRTKYSSL
ncbi:MAG: ABC transporter permease subunit [Proteobacteria bacterium]|nr:ABC transporter permease subunit [Pseudomonadota bacterium]NOG60525.1 ABC transporter permease subunit [Pseudomonadota bacterium]